MAGENDLDELDLEDEELEEDEEAVDDTDTDSDSDSEDGKDESKLDKRIRDLQSKADAAVARANKAEAALAGKSRKALGGEGDGLDPGTQALIADLREASLDAVTAEMPELKEYGIDRSLIEGTTRAEIRDSASALVSVIKKVATSARNKALADAGITPAPVGSRREKAVDITSMSRDDFLKYVDENRG